MTEEQFNSLLSQVKSAYEKSEISKEELYYSICSTRITPNNLLILGFNWGAKEDRPYLPQTVYPKVTFKEATHLGVMSIVRSWIYGRYNHFFKEKELDNIGQSNFCFFRSRNQDQLRNPDLQLTIPLFHQFLAMAQPSKIIGFSSLLREYWVNESLISSLEEPQPNFYTKSGRVFVYKGMYNGEIPVRLLPHPNNMRFLASDLRDKLWAWAFEED